MFGARNILGANKAPLFVPPGRETSDPFAAQTQLLLIASQGYIDLKGLTAFDTKTAPLVAQNALDGQAFQFNGDTSTQLASSTSTAVSSTVSPYIWTFEAWIRPDRVNVNQCLISDNTTSSVGKLSVTVNASAHAAYVTNLERTSSTLNIQANTWNHVALVHQSTDNTSGMLVFVNGKMQGMSGNFGSNFSGTGLSIGSYLGGGLPFKGLIDSVRQTAAARYTAEFNPLQFYR